MSFIQDREFIGVFRKFEDAVDALTVVTLGKTWREGDIYAIYEIEREDIYEEGLSQAVFTLTLYGPRFRNLYFESLYHEHCKTQPVTREVCF